jgi:hypothetical protein
MSSFFNLDSMQQQASSPPVSEPNTTETTMKSQPHPSNTGSSSSNSSSIDNEIVTSHHLDVPSSSSLPSLPQTEINTSETNREVPCRIEDDVSTPIEISSVDAGTTTVPSETTNDMDDNERPCSSKIESSIITDRMQSSGPNGIDDNDKEREIEGNNNTASTSSLPVLSSPTHDVAAPGQTTNTETSSSEIDATTTTSATTGGVSSFVNAETAVMDTDHHDCDTMTENMETASEPIAMVVEADEETSHSNSIQDHTTLSANEALILPHSTSVTINHNEILPKEKTTESLVENVVVDPHHSPQHFVTTDDSSDATTAPFPEHDIHRSTNKHDHTTPVETIPEKVVVPVVMAANIDNPRTTYCSNNGYDNNSNNNDLILSPMTPSPNVTKQRPTKKLLLLISTNSIDRQVKVRQDLVQTALTAAKIEYDVIDGSLHDNETNKTIRNELFALSGLRGVYPQFFIVNLEPPYMDDGHKTGTSFWGTFEQFQHVNDDGQLQQAFGDVGHISSDHNKTISRNLYPSETLPGVGEASNLTENISKDKATTLTVPDDIYEKFSQQIQRIEENYQVERQETEQRHLQALQHQQQLYQQCELEKRELEEKLSNELRQKDEQLQEMYRRNEGFRLKLDGLKREVTGTQELLHGRDQELQKANQKYLNDLRAMEKRMNNSEKSANKYQEEAQSIQAKLDNTEAELQSSKQEYETMKERAKDIAAELKHRRSECRQLQDSVAELTEQNNRLKSTVHSLEERLNHQGLNQSDKDKEIDMLRAQLTEAKEKMKTIENVWQEKLTKSENILVEYKKRAQHSLSMSNSRTAAAVQAREEAELDARAARSTADAALERSVKAEVEAREAIAKAKLTVKAMEEEKDEAMKRSDEMKCQLMAAEQLQVEKEKERDSLLSTIQNKDMEIDRLRGCMNEADAKIASTQRKIMEYTNTIDDLRGEISALRAELQRATASAVTVASAKNEDDGSKVMKYTPSQILVNGSNDSEDDSPLAALRMELREANDAIEDLKSALKNAVEMNEELQRTYSGSEYNITSPPDNTSRSDVGQTQSTDAIPLFYAMEKQAELKTARTEMNRLASLLADVQSEKMEAYDAMEEMRRRLDEAESRLKRHEKLGMASNVLNTTDEATHDNNISSAVNIEYLKHILLRFMNAKTQTERKTLVPVIGAVLELTPDEVQAATQNIERQSASIVTGNGNSLFSFLS